jgi:hypothetical protein
MFWKFLIVLSSLGSATVVIGKIHTVRGVMYFQLLLYIENSNLSWMMQSDKNHD